MRYSNKHMLAGLSVLFALAGCSRQGQDDGQPKAPMAENVPAATQILSPPEFKGDFSALTVGGNCSLDAINGVKVTNPLGFRKTDDVTVAGWMSDASGKVPVDAKFVLRGAQKTYSIPVSAGEVRQDVAQTLKNDALKLSGFELPLALSGAQAGEYDLAVLVGVGQLCSFNTKLKLED